MTNRGMRAVLVGFAAALLAGSIASAEPPASDHKAQFRLGARLWPQTCGSCHKARPGGERSPAEWNTIMMHMRSVANLPAEDARAIREFLRSH